MARKNSNLISPGINANIQDRSLGIAALSVGGFTQRRVLNAGDTTVTNLEPIQTQDDFTQVFKNGVMLNTSDYTLDSATGITLLNAAVQDDEITIRSIVEVVGTAKGAATGGGSDEVFFENGQTVTTSYTVSSNKNAMSAGPITINSNVTVTIPANATWVII